MASFESIGYAGYGPNSDPDLIEAITGEIPTPIGHVAILQNVELCVQGLEDVPDVPIADNAPSVRDILGYNYGPDFEAYTLRPRQGGIVRGRLVTLSPIGFAQMMEWDMVNEGWFKPFEVQAGILPHMDHVRVHTTGLREDQSIKRVVDDPWGYQDFLVDKDRMIEVATQVRLDRQRRP